jgi:Zn-dependent membrane protease YugP
MTSADAAVEVLRKSGIGNVKVERVKGNLTDHFDPKTNTIRLSENVYDAPTVVAVGVAAHEAGHAVQYAKGYVPMKARAAIIPVTSIGSKMSMPMIIMGLLMGMPGLINLGIVLFGAVVLFQLVTLPVEFNASSRAIEILADSGMLTAEELPGSKKVLSAAAMTYVAALATSLAQLIRLVAMSKRRRR